MLNEFEKNVSNKENSGDIIANVTCSHNASVSSKNLSQYNAQLLNLFKSKYSSDGSISNVIYPNNLVSVRKMF